MNNKQGLIYLRASHLFCKIQTKEGNMYSKSFFLKHLEWTQNWIQKREPKKAIIRLRRKNQCSYCNIILTDKNGEGDHIVGKSLDSLLWLVPCCKSCNSSKFKNDLLDWWVIKKQRDILDLSKDVISVYVRARFRILENENKLHNNISKGLKESLNQLPNFYNLMEDAKKPSISEVS